MLSVNPNIGITTNSSSPIAARIHYDNSISNCFGYLSEGHQNAYEIINSSSSITSNYGFFVVRTFEPNEIDDSVLVMQIFFPESLHFLHSTSLPILSLNGQFSSANKFSNGEMVLLRLLSENAPIRCETVVINPLEGDDWDKISSSAAQAEELLLRQLRVIQSKMHICIHFNDGKIANFFIGDILPNTQMTNCNGNNKSFSSHPAAFLMTVGTRVFVAALSSNEKQKSGNKEELDGKCEMGVLTETMTNHGPFSIDFSNMSSFDPTNIRPTVLRVLSCPIANFIPLPVAASSNPFFASHRRLYLLLNNLPFIFVPYGTFTDSENKEAHAIRTCCVYVQLNCDENAGPLAEAVLVELSQSPHQTSKPLDCFCDRLSLLFERFCHSSSLNHCWISPTLHRLCRRSIRLRWIRIHPIPANQLKPIDNLIICSSIRENLGHIKQAFMELVASARELHTPWLFPKSERHWFIRLKKDDATYEHLNRNNESEKHFFVKLTDGDEKPIESRSKPHYFIWPLSSTMTFEFRQFDVHQLGFPENQEDEHFPVQIDEATDQSPLKCSAQIVECPAQQFVLLSLSHSIRTFLNRLSLLSIQKMGGDAGEDTPMPLVLLLDGPYGSGKSTLLATLSKKLQSVAGDCEFVPIAVQSINCSAAGNSLCHFLTCINSAMQNLVERWPSVLFFDNFDTFIEKCSNEDVFLTLSAQNELTKRLLCRKIFEKLFEEPRRRRIPIVCAISGKNNVLEEILAGSEHLFKSEVHRIGPIDKPHELVDKLFSSEVTTLFSQIESVNFETIGDLCRLVEKLEVRGVAANRTTDGSRIESEDIFSIASICKRDQFGEGELSIGFDQIAGLDSVKKQLVQLFIWPARYPTLFAMSGVRIGHRALLHGPSGCGKSMLLRALVQEMGVNVFSVRGPQLLSKYIGQSEQNVRQLFSKAKASKPALIIFDEIDAIAPQRGSDNGHVTDRLVNQMLTELDGFEGDTERVFVVAVTNRIDLVDRALLRPGRFDSKLYIGLPDFGLRLAILRFYSAREWGVHLSDNVNLKLIAQQTEGFSGVEIRAVVQNALNLSERDLKKDGSFGSQVPRVCQKHFNWAIEHFGKKMGKCTTNEGETLKQKLTFRC